MSARSFASDAASWPDWKLGVRVRYEKIVPRPDADAIGVIEADCAAGVELDQRMRVIHHRAVAEPARREIVREAERVPDLVRGELAQPRERHLLRLVRKLARVRLVVRREQRLGDQDVLAHTLRSQRHRSLDDLAGARIDDRLPVRPAARVAMRPGDDAVADVHRVHAFGQELDAVGVLETRLFERALPPVRALEQRRAHRLGRAAVEIEHDRLANRALRGRWIGLVEPETRLVAHVEARCERLRIVVEADAESARCRMIKARRIARRRQSHEAQVLAQRQALGLHRDILDERLIARALERQHRFELGVVRKALRVLGGWRAAILVDLVLALLGIGETARDAMQIGRQQRADIDDDLGVLALALARDVAGPEHRFGERLAHAFRFIGVRRDGAELRVVLDEQEPRTGAAELDQMRFAALAAIETDVIGAQASRQRRDQQERPVQIAHAEQHAAFRGVAVYVEETGDVLAALRCRRQIGRRLRGGLAGRRRRGQRGGAGRYGKDERECGRARRFHRRLPSVGMAQFARCGPLRACRNACRRTFRLHRRRAALIWAS